MDKSKNTDNKAILNNENYHNLQNKIIQNKYENENQEENEIIIELEMANVEKKKEINILCDKEQLFNDNKENEAYYIENNIKHPKNLIILMKTIQNYI